MYLLFYNGERRSAEARLPFSLVARAAIYRYVAGKIELAANNLNELI
jgi:hypothetical protein